MEGYIPAVEKVVYTLESSTDKLAVIRKQYEFLPGRSGQ